MVIFADDIANILEETRDKILLLLRPLILRASQVSQLLGA